MATAAIGRREPTPSFGHRLPDVFRSPEPAPPRVGTVAPEHSGPPEFFTQGDGSVFNDLTDVRRMVRRLPAPEQAVANFPDRVRHAFTAEDFDFLSNWFARAAEAWREHQEATHVAAE